MTISYSVSPSLGALIQHAERVLGATIALTRQSDAPSGGLLIDSYTYATPQNVVVFPSSHLGMLKDVVIAQNCAMLLLKGAASKTGTYRVLSFDEHSASIGMTQIYLDILKDAHTRTLGILSKQKIAFAIYMLFHEALTEVPWEILSRMYLAQRCEVFRNAETYLLIKESMRDMHELVALRECIPRRYFALYNGLFYARDCILAEKLSAYELNPLINIPELRKFRHLDVKEMMTHRWRTSAWYHTKRAGDVLYRELANTLTLDFTGPFHIDAYAEIFRAGTEITNRWMHLMQISDWYRWESPAHLKDAIGRRDEIQKRASEGLFSSV
jgi:hypothetical protein